jgi:pyruvate kinase
VEPRLTPGAPPEHEGVVALAETEAAAHGLLPSGGIIVVTHGAPLGERPATNLLRIHSYRV